MKKPAYILTLLLLSVSATSCTKWLTVEPVTETSSQQLTATEEGLKQILAGTYIKMSTEAYRTTSGPYSPEGHMGGNGEVEWLSGTWTTTAHSSTNHLLSTHNYASLEDDALNSIFLDLYNLIANINPAINGMVANKANIKPASYNLIRGEALGIRALVHLDLMRIFGPAPYAVDPEVRYLPYVTANSNERYPYYTFNEYMDMVLADLNEAEALLRESDPILTQTFAQTEMLTLSWPNNRKSCLNYYGILALQARARLWRNSAAHNDREEALRYARMVKDAVDVTPGTRKFRLTTADDFGTTSRWSADKLCYSEHITGVSCRYYDYNRGYLWKPGTITLINDLADFTTVLFDGNLTDIRYTKYWGYSSRPTKGFYTTKYTCFYPESNSPMNFPIVRLSEIYFMIMELGSLDEANQLYQEYCTTRNIEFEPMTEQDRSRTILLESLREYVGEGQNFFTYKRNGARSMLFVEGEISDEMYRVPLPEGAGRVIQ